MKTRFLLVTIPLLAITCATSITFADSFDQGDYSTDGDGPCYRGTACGQLGDSPVETWVPWKQCRDLSKDGRAISWMNRYGKCLYLDPSGD